TISWLCGRSIAPLVRTVAEVDTVIELDDSRLLAGRRPAQIAEMARTWVRLFGRRFDLVITAHADARYGYLTKTVRARERRSFFPRARGRWLIPGRHHSNEYVRLVTGLDGPDAPSAQVRSVKLPLPAFLVPLLNSSATPLVALAPGGTKSMLQEIPLRRWPLEHYGKLAARLLTSGCRVAITGSTSDVWVRGAFKGMAVIDLIEKTSLTDLLAFYGACNAVITHDTGSLHLAMLSGTPVVALFGPTRPNERILPNQPGRVLWGGEKLACRPCYDGTTYAPCVSNRCLREITVETVLNAVEDVVGKTSAAPPSSRLARATAVAG
ncbi:MAG: glycosyltransferase family 9 protein, partial [Candidatus Binataceae bacterium]